MRDRDDHVLVDDEVLVAQVAVGRDDLGAPVVAVLLDDLRELERDDLALTLRLGEHVLEVFDLTLEIGEPVDRLLPLHRREATQLRVEDVRGLDLVDVEQRHQPGARGVGVLRAADQRDDLVEHVEGLDQAAQDVGLLLGAPQAEPRPAHDDLDLVPDPVRDELVQAQRPRHVVHEREHVAAERVLQAGVLV